MSDQTLYLERHPQYSPLADSITALGEGGGGGGVHMDTSRTQNTSTINSGFSLVVLLIEISRVCKCGGQF